MNSKKSKKIMKQILLPCVAGIACVWLLTFLWNFSEVGMMRKTLEIIGHEPEKVYVDFPESKIFEDRIFYQDKIIFITTGGAGPTYQQSVSFEDFKVLSKGQPYAVSSHKVIDQKLKVTLTGNTVDGIMRYSTVIEKKIDIPKGKRFIGLKYVDGKIEISQQPDFGDASWRLVFERVIYLIVFVIALYCLLFESMDRKCAEKREYELRKQLSEESAQKSKVITELIKLKKQLADIERQKTSDSGAGD